MKHENLILELAGWGLDDNPDRRAADGAAQAQARAQKALASLPDWNSPSPTIDDLPLDMQNALVRNSERADLRTEFHGYAWTIGVVDLRRLVSFQRRLNLNRENLEACDLHEWTSRVQVALPQRRSSSFECAWQKCRLTLTSENPDFTVRWQADQKDTQMFALAVHHGSPFMEVGCYQKRWFLRDGYHRAYRLLRAGIFEIPAVIVQAATLEELGADRPWFFPEQVLFSRRPPLVTDFLAEELVFPWNRPARRKVVRISISEGFELLNPEQEQSHEHCNKAR